jgi:hypothetical protein
MNIYKFVTSGYPGNYKMEILWKGNLGNPVATCTNVRDARRIVDALNAVPPASSGPALEWIAVGDRLPDDDILVLAYVAESGQMVMAAHEDRGWYADDSILVKSGVTHWADPAPPQP